MHSLVDKAEARREHEPCRDGIGGTEPPAGGVLRESEWHGAEPGGNRREQREEKDRSCANRFHTLYTTRSRFRPRAFTLRTSPWAAASTCLSSPRRESHASRTASFTSGMLLKSPFEKYAERTITALAFNSMSASQIARFSTPSTGYETCLERITSARCRASSPSLVTARISRKAPLVRKNSSCARRVSTSPS